MWIRSNTRPGQTLVELLIAIAILATVIISTVGLILFTLGLAESSKLQIIGANLAREGIEVIRNTRDSNWLKVDGGDALAQWNTGLFSGTGNTSDYTGVAVFSLPGCSGCTADQQGKWALDFSAGAVNPQKLDWGDPKTTVYQDSVTQLYTQWLAALPASYRKSGFYRLLTLHPVCWQNNNRATEQVIAANSVDCTSFGAGYSEVGIEARSEVRWYHRSAIRTVTLVEKAYDWKP